MHRGVRLPGVQKARWPVAGRHSPRSTKRRRYSACSLGASLPNNARPVLRQDKLRRPPAIMNNQYSEYLQSPEWQKKRVQRLHRAGNQCQACEETNGLHVHHLTYARIFREPMDDLMVLCDLHHKAAEEMVRSGVLTRIGSPALLATQTLRAISPKSVFLKDSCTPDEMRARLRSDIAFLELLKLPTRNAFKKAFKMAFKKKPMFDRLYANALIIWDKES